MMKLQQYGLPRGSRNMLSMLTILLYYFCEVHIQTSLSLNDSQFPSTSSSTSSSTSTRTSTSKTAKNAIGTSSLFRFKHSSYNVTIPENSIGKTYAKSLPYEDLMGLRVLPHCEVKFRIISGDRDKLFKAEDRIVGDFAFLTIRTRTGNVVLNREKNEDYLLRVKGAVKYFSASNVTTYETETFVYIKVLDRNDLSPLFYPTEYSKTIPEDMPLHKSILKVFAEDADLGINGEIYYSFATENDFFSIHPTTGVITLVKQLHFVENSYFELMVLANDRGSAINHNSHQASKAKVFIFVKQVNLYAPEIYVKTLPNTAMDTNSLIYGIVRVNDKDTGRHGEIGKLEIVDGDPEGNFCIKPTEISGEFYIQINRLARLTQQYYNLTLRAEDKGVPVHYSYKALSVNIVGQSKHSPVFTKELYEISIAETSPPNMPVLRLKVIDPDLSRNALVFLEIVGGNEGGEFRINPDSGMLYTQKSLDAETKSFYTLTVSAIDQSNISVRKQSSAKVKINIEDMNDNDPVFEPINSTLTIEENKPAGTFVAKVMARDRDSGENAYLTYSIANLNDVPFEIEHFSGEIKTTVLLDYETMQRNYLLSIRASDWGLPYRRQTELNLLIQLKDVNDNRPQFERVNCVGKIWRNAPVGTDIFTLSAIDFDAGDFITYRLISGNEDGCFNLDTTTGVLTVGCDLRDVSVLNRVVNVSATDGTHFSDELSIHITIVDEGADVALQQIDVLKGYGAFECRETGVARRLAEILAAAERNNAHTLKSLNDLPPTPQRYRKNLHAPEFIDFPLELKINESLSLGETVMRLTARDRDLGYNGKLVYAITDGDYDSVFRIDADTGEFQIIGYLDRERQEHYTLNISVFDLGQPQKTQSKLLPVTILDSNDNPPVFQKSLASFRLTENAKNGTTIFCLNATDADAAENAKVTYNMQTETQDFYLNSTTGCISVNGVLDREKQASYDLRVIAKDGGVTPLTAEAVVNIMLEDINDNAPLFGVQELIFKVREDIPRGTTIATIEAIDFDSGPNGEIYFSLKDDKLDNGGLFKINKYSGVIQTRGYLDYETRQIHNLIVSAIDRGTPSLTSDMPVVIEVIDVNENRYAPEFGDFVYNGSIKENQPKGTFIMNVTAKDADTNELDAKVSYSIVGGDGLGIFAVNDKGSIRTISHLDAESKSSYWITLCAQDHAIVPLSSCVQVFISVENENDNVPLTDKPVYYHTVPEGSPQGRKIMRLKATDKDNNPAEVISYKITSGNPEGFFMLNATTGELFTTERKLDRENQWEHILEISISDNGLPALSSTTRVVISVEDINDNAPEFDQRFYKVQVPSTAGINDTIFQVQAFDNDIGENGRITYSLKSGKGKHKFHIDPNTGYIFITKPLEIDVEYELNIRAEDNGNTSRSQTARLNIDVVPIIQKQNRAPIIKTVNAVVDVTETDRPGFLVTLIQAVDEDDDRLWYNISDGDVRNEFFIGRDNGNVLLSKYLDWETQRFYNLSIIVTDGLDSVQTSLYVNVVDTNDNRPQFTESSYYVNITENIEEETIIMQLHATDRDEDKKILYTLHAAQEPTSLGLFRVDSLSGNVLVTQQLDYEKTKQHILIVMAKDQGTPSKRDYAQLVITVFDHNDHYPEFTNRIIQCKFPESAPIGAKVVQLEALDRDSGKNGEINYAIITGNIGNAFSVDTWLGTLTLAKPLDITQMQEYMLQVRATDLGNPPLSTQLPVHIMLTMAEYDPPKFLQPIITLEIFENQPIGTFALQVEARSSSTVFYDITAGNEDDCFRINPTTGVIVTNDNIDYERKSSFNLTVTGTNMASATAQQSIVIHVLDLNDNAPYFLQREYIGEISEAAEIGSFVMLKGSLKNSPLVLNSTDADTGINSIIKYSITNDLAKRFFEIDSLTGTIKLINALDFESIPDFKFEVMINDMGTPKLFSYAFAKVHIFVEDINDCTPIFETKESNEMLYVPTYANVIVAHVKATDADFNGNTTLRYDIVDGNDEDNCFQIDSVTGIITTRIAEIVKPFYSLYIRASDGLYSALTQVNVKTAATSNDGFTFQKLRYEFFTLENSTKISKVGLVNVVGNMLHEYVVFRILNPTEMFQIGPTSGAIKTTGMVFDRELQDNYTLVIEAKSIQHNQDSIRRAHVIADVRILDINDNCPMFVNLPYYAIVSVDDVKGAVITTVKAVDLDSGENGEVRYEMKKGNGELFKVDRKTGEITLKQSVERRSSDFTLIVSAYDGAITPCSTDVTVTIKIVDKSMPVFDKQFYYGTAKEDIEIFSALPTEIRAESPLQRKLIYTISKGNDDELFEIDYRTGTIYVVNSLDYETKLSHELIIRATDSVTGIYAEVTVSITVEDANDCYPNVERDLYNITLLESLKPGSLIIKLNATDCDSGLNGETYFTIDATREQNISKIFSIDAASGSLYLKSSLDYETQTTYIFSVTVTDRGTPSLSTKVNVWISVQNVNDNTPKFLEPSFSCLISANAVRGQFVFKAKAFDLDLSDNDKLTYKIVDGNEMQTFVIGSSNGIIRLQSAHTFSNSQYALLNVSVTDGIHTSYARVKISIMPENLYSPTFSKAVYEAEIDENEMPGTHIITVKATDPDLGKYSTIRYEIMSKEMADYFDLDANTGTLSTRVAFDSEKRAQFEVNVKAVDGGERTGFTLIKVKVNDRNDNPPFFQVKEYRATFKTDVMLNTTLCKFNAIDVDEVSKHDINYKIDAKTLDPMFTSYLHLNESSGDLKIVKPPDSLLNKEIQFFVSAFDSSAPEMHNVVPVSLQFVDSNLELPEPESAIVKLNVLESTPPGTVLYKVKMSGNYSMKFSVITVTASFSITENGELLLAQSLDREEKESHYVVVLTETATTPSLYSTSEFYVFVKDENDNYPIFDSNFYSTDIAENMDKVSTILKVTATDLDSGPNGDIRYYLDETSQVSDIFDIDIYTGWITSLKCLDKETQSEYYFNVLATDNGQPKHVSKATVMVKVADYNDNPAVFSKEKYHVSVLENALPGTVLTQFFLTDLDSEKMETLFEIISGDNYSRFQVSKNGELFVYRALDRETMPSYELQLLATDGKYVTETEVSVTVEDVNDNIPYCITPRYSVVINESIPIGTYVLKATAIDFDEQANQKIRYYLTGVNCEDFAIEKDTGILKVAKQIDREKQAKYILRGHAQDGEELQRECSFEIFIAVQDINDNRPVFSLQQYVVSVPEDAHVQTVLTKVHATDKDFGMNRKITYSMIDSHNHFNICATTGIVKLLKSLDRESIPAYNLTVTAVDHGQPQLFSTASLIINVLDINDNPPEFASNVYVAYVLENATVNIAVTKVFATSKDIGVNAEIRYFIVGGNEQQKFRINTKTGTIYVDGEVDYEKTKNYYLTVQALDGGTPPLSSLASVNITILDVNDNVPKFTQNLYRVQIPENIQQHERIIQLIATDEDTQQNGIIHFHIAHGDKYKQFAIDEPSGAIYTSKLLDRENISTYKLEIKACDNGTPELCSFSQVHIELVDVNDNAPLFSQRNYSVFLRENKDIGYILLNFEISDADVYPNTQPYTFDFRMGNEGGLFRLEQDGKLRTAGRFNHKLRSHYELLIRVFDNGTPPLYSDTWVNVAVIEESQYPPLITPLEITVNSFDDEFSGGYLGQVHATDQDKYDVLQFSLTQTDDEPYVIKNLFNISADTGALLAISNIDVGYYRINVSVTDGKYVSNTIVKVFVELITEEMLKNAVIIRFSQVSPEAFILSHRKAFNKLLRTVMSCRQKDIYIISLQNATESKSDSESLNAVNQLAHKRTRRAFESLLDVVVAVKKQQIIPNPEQYFSPKEIHEALLKRIDEVNDITNLILEDIIVPQCAENACVNGNCYSQLVMNKQQLLTVSTDVISFAAPSFEQVNACQCREGFDGVKCDVSVNACSSNPCQAQQQCLPANSDMGYQCICPTGYTGQLCDTASNRCANSSCTHALTSVSFSGKSYAHYRINKFLAKNAMEKQFIYALKVRTVQQTGTLLYASGRIDFHVLEILNGAVQYRFELGSGVGVVAVTSVYISDGEWHTIYLERVLNSAKLIVDKKHVSQSSAPGVNELLNIQSNDIFVGAEVRPHPSIIGFEDIQKGYIGCMADIKLSYQPLPLYISGGSSIAALKRFTNVEFTCNPLSVLVALGICGAQPCMHGGRCLDFGNNTFKCDCHARFSGKLCEFDLDPCASNPCLFGGRCEQYGPSNYTCHCPLHLTGMRCENGKFCTPNPCKNNGICEEGDGTPHCLCRGYTGPTCEIDINECDNQPCGNGATCINEAGSFRCICPYYLTGASCGDPLYSNSISTKLKNLSKAHLTGIITGTTLIFVVIIIVLCCLVLKKNASNIKKRNIKSIRKSNCKEHNLNSLIDKEKYCKPNPKLSNLEVNQRPLSYTATGSDNFPNHTTFLNNLDVLQSYGSAGDELENIPFEYQKINRTYQKRNINGCTLSNVDAIQKGCCEQMHLKTFSENKLNNATLKPTYGKSIQVALPNICRSTYADDSTVHGEYHWDCSDWIRKSQNPLPDITEVPGAEVADSSSFHSDDSNESKAKNTHLSQCYGKVNPARDITTLNEDMTSEYAESDMGCSNQANMFSLIANNSLSRLSTNNKTQDYILNTVPLKMENNIPRMMYLHSNSYISPSNNPSETETDSCTTGLLLGEETDKGHNRSRKSCNNGSNSDLSVHICEIEDLELEEFLPADQPL